MMKSCVLATQSPLHIYTVGTYTLLLWWEMMSRVGGLWKGAKAWKSVDPWTAHLNAVCVAAFSDQTTTDITCSLVYMWLSLVPKRQWSMCTWTPASLHRCGSSAWGWTSLGWWESLCNSLTRRPAADPDTPAHYLPGRAVPVLGLRGMPAPALSVAR